MNNWVNELKYILMPSRHPVNGFEKEYHEAYAVWRNAWDKFRDGIGVSAFLNSDGFIIPDEMGVLFYKDKCVGFSSFTYGSMNGPTSHLGWFNAWPTQAIEDLKKISTEVVICSQFTVNPEFAGKDQIVRWKEIVSLYSMLRFENSIAGVMAGHLNLTRGMQNACGENHGATVLNPNSSFNYYGVDIPAQLVAYERHNIQAMIDRKDLRELSEALWSRVINLSEFPIATNVTPIRKAA